MEINGNLYLVSRTKRIECDMGINDVLVCAKIGRAVQQECRDEVKTKLKESL